MVQEFKEFINRGNVVDLAVAVVIGGAFALVVDSFTNDILMQLVAAIVGEPDFSSLTFEISDTPILYGSFLTVMINFLIVAFAIFLFVKGYNSLKKEAPAEEAGPSEVDLLTEIRDALRSSS